MGLCNLLCLGGWSVVLRGKSFNTGHHMQNLQLEFFKQAISE